MRKEKQQHLPFVTPPIAPVAARAPVEDAAALKARGSLTHGRQEVRAPQNCEIKEWRDAKDRFVKYNLHVIFRNTKFEYARSFAKSYFGLYVLYVRTASSRSLARPPRSDPCSVPVRALLRLARHQPASKELELEATEEVAEPSL